MHTQPGPRLARHAVSPARGSPESTATAGAPSPSGRTHLRSSPPQSLPAGSCPWPGPRRRLRAEPGRCPFSVCGAWPVAGTRQGGQRETPSARRSVAHAVSRAPPQAGGGPRRSPGPRAADSTPPADLKGEAGRRAPRAGTPEPPRGSQEPARLPPPSPLPTAEPPRREAKCPLVPAMVRIASHAVNDCRDIFANFITRKRGALSKLVKYNGLFTCGDTSFFVVVFSRPLKKSFY